MANQPPLFPVIAARVLACSIIWTGHTAADERNQKNAAVQYQMVVVTDDDFLARDQKAWCHAELTHAVDQVRTLRSEAQFHISTQFAGEPELLTATKLKSGPRRAICFICNAENQVLSFCVGVPSSRNLTGLVEDADQGRLLQVVGSLQDESAIDPKVQKQDELSKAIQERSSRRVLNTYKPLLSSIDRQTSIGIAVTRLMPALNEDRADRFQIVEATDRLRWISLQQHPETMRHWCDAILPAIITKDVQSVWPEIASFVWDAQPWTVPPSDSDLIPWYSETISSGPIVLSIASDDAMLGQLQPPASKDAEFKKSTDIDVKAITANVSHRQISIASLALLMQHRKDRPAKLLSVAWPSPIWAVIENERSPIELVYGRSIDRIAQIVRKLTPDR